MPLGYVGSHYSPTPKHPYPDMRKKDEDEDAGFLMPVTVVQKKVDGKVTKVFFYAQQVPKVKSLTSDADESEFSYRWLAFQSKKKSEDESL